MDKYLAHAINDMAESRIDDVVFRNTKERCEWGGIWNIVCGKCGKGVYLIGNKMNLVFVAESHIFNHNVSRIASTTLVPRNGGILSERIMRSTNKENPSLNSLLFGSQ